MRFYRCGPILKDSACRNLNALLCSRSTPLVPRIPEVQQRGQALCFTYHALVCSYDMYYHWFNASVSCVYCMLHVHIPPDTCLLFAGLFALLYTSLLRMYIPVHASPKSASICCRAFTTKKVRSHGTENAERWLEYVSATAGPLRASPLCFVIIAQQATEYLQCAMCPVSMSAALYIHTQRFVFRNSLPPPVRLDCLSTSILVVLDYRVLLFEYDLPTGTSYQVQIT